MINFVKRGSGKKTLVFLHGWGGSWQSWTSIIQRLQNKYTIYALDLPGFGLSPLPRVYDLADYVADLTEFFKKNRIIKPVLIGHSFGGQIAAKLAIEKRNLLSKLVLVDAAIVRDNSSLTRVNIKVAQIGKKIVKNSPIAGYYARVRDFYYAIRGIEVTKSDYIKAGDTPFLAETLAKIMREDLTSDLVEIKVPTLIFWGEKDHPDYTPIKQAKIIHKAIIGSKLVVASGAGHFSYLDDEELFCRELTSFI